MINHTGSVIAQNNQDYVSSVERPVEMESERDVYTDNDDDIMNESEIVLSNKLNIMSLNIKRISMSKYDYLYKQLEEHSISVLLLQETHICETAPPARYSITNFHLVSRINHEQYGIMIYARDPGLVSDIHENLLENNIHISSIKIEDLRIENVYKPPNVPWPTPALPQ